MNVPRKLLINRRNLAAIVLGMLLVLGVCVWWRSDRPALPGEADQLILYSIDGNDYEKGKGPKTAETFHQYPVLGKLEITDKSAQKEILEAMKDGMAYNGPGNKCFWPRHAIRTVKNGAIVDVAICFECCQYRVFDAENLNTKVIGSSPQAILNRFLTAAGVPLAPGMKTN